jgi:hypothetical protein
MTSFCGNTSKICENPKDIEGTDLCYCGGIHRREIGSKIHVKNPLDDAKLIRIHRDGSKTVDNLRFLHNHPDLEQRVGMDIGLDHVIVDREDWELARKLLIR